jgi:hypothetical protein
MNARCWLFVTVLVGLLCVPNSASFGQDVGAANATRTTSLDAGTFVLVAVKGSNQFLSYGTDDGQWDRHEFAAGVSSKPYIDRAGVMGLSGPIRATAGFQLDGESITELVAVDSKGRFHKHALSESVRGPLTPIVSNGLVYYVAGGKIHAFSAKTGTWDSMDAPQLSDLKVENGGIRQPEGLTALDGTLVVEFENQIAAFSINSGKWTSETFARR